METTMPHNLNSSEITDELHDTAVQGNLDPFRSQTVALDELRTRNKNTILHIHIAARRRSEESLEFVKQVLDLCPALLWSTNGDVESLLHFAARRGDDDLVEVVIDRVKSCGGGVGEMLLLRNGVGNTALHEALRYNQLEVVKILLNEYVEFSSYDANDANETPLYLAVERSNSPAVSTILEHCISPAAHMGPFGRTTLHMPVIHNDQEMLRKILDKTATTLLTRKGDEDGWIPLHYASYFGFLDIFRQLLQADKFTGYIADNEGKTPLHVAVSHGHTDIVQEILLRCPSSFELVDCRGWNVFDFALDGKNQELLELLLNQRWLCNLVNMSNAHDNAMLPWEREKGEMDEITRDVAADDENGIVACKKEDIGTKERISSKAMEAVTEPVDNAEQIDHVLDAIKSEFRERERKRRLAEYLAMKEAKGTHLVVATLISTVSFAAAMTMPGGYFSSGSHEGGAILTKTKAFRAFVVTNTLAFLLSSSSVFANLFMANQEDRGMLDYLFEREASLTNVSMLFMVAAFVTGTFAVLVHSSGLAIYTCVLGSVFLVLFYFLAVVLSVILQ